MRTGILGHPQSGKTTLFNILARAHAPTGAFASASGGVNIGAVQVPDARLESLRDLFHPKKYTPARIEYVDLAGPAGGKEKADALLPQQITISDLILVVVRAFENASVPHPRGTVDPMRDLGDFLDELVLKDMAVLDARLQKLRKGKQVGAKQDAEELPLLERCYASLEAGTPMREMKLGVEEERALRGFQLGDGEAAARGVQRGRGSGGRCGARRGIPRASSCRRGGDLRSRGNGDRRSRRN